MTIRNFAQFVTGKQLQKGDNYFRLGKVSELKTDRSGQWTATVQGREPYEVQIGTRNGQVRWVLCECIAHSEEEYCKHVVAVLYAIQQEEGLLVMDDELEEMVSKLSKAQLRDFVLEQARNNPDLQEEIMDLVQEEEEEEDEDDVDGDEDPDDIGSHKVSAAVQKIFKKMLNAVDAKDYAGAKALAEEQMQKAKDKGDDKTYTDIQLAILAALKNTADVMGTRELARRFYKETRDMRFYKVLKATYVMSEWEKVVAAHISRLQAKMPEYLAGTANPAELADVYVEEYSDGDELLKLLQKISRLSLLNKYAKQFHRDYDKDLLTLYRDLLSSWLNENKKGADTAEFLKAVQRVSKLRNGKTALKELAPVIKQHSPTLFAALPENCRN